MAVAIKGTVPRDALAAAIRESLGDDPALPLRGVEITLIGVDVVLAGSVDWRYQRERIEYLVERVEGIRSVRNEIAVTPTVDAGEAIAADIAKAAERAAPGGADSIRVEADGDGILTLFGNVRSEASYRAALACAWAVAGVQDVRERFAVAR